MRLDLVVEAKGKDGFGEPHVGRKERVTLSVTPRALSQAKREHGGAVRRQGTESLSRSPRTPQPCTTLPTQAHSYLSWVPSARPATKM